MITSKIGYFASRGASKIGLTPGKRLKLSIKYNKAKKKLGNKIFDIKKTAGIKYQNLSSSKKAAIKGFGTGLKYGTFGVGSLAVGKGAYDLGTGKRSITLKKSDPRYKALKKKGYV